MIAPAVFVSHGTPMLASPSEDDPVVAAWHRFRSHLGRPKAIVALSSHHHAGNEVIAVNATERWQAFHDFRGFQAELYAVEYSARGSPELAARVAQLLTASRGQIPVSLTQRNLVDHGIWVPLLHFFPQADIPIVTVALPENATPRDFLAAGHALRELRREGVMILGSGGATHNLSLVEWHSKRGEPLPEMLGFEHWLIDQLTQRNVEAIIQAPDTEPEFTHAHPTLEHFNPLLFVVGAALEKDDFEVIHQGVEYRALSMLAFALEQRIH